MAAIVVPIIAAFYLGGPGVGVAAGALAAVAIVVAAVRQRPRGEIGAAPAQAERRRLLIVIGRAVEEPTAIQRIAAAVSAAAAASAASVEVMVLSPARIGFFDRWASDVEGARRAAQQRLVITVAALAKAGVAAEARVGDEDLVQAVEDQLCEFSATDVILVGAAPGEDADEDAAAADLEERLLGTFERVSG